MTGFFPQVKVMMLGPNPEGLDPKIRSEHIGVFGTGLGESPGVPGE